MSEQDAPADGRTSPIFVLDLDGGSTKRLEGHADEVLAVAVSPDGRHLLSGGKDGAMHLWDLETGGRLQSYAGHEGSVRSLSFSPDGLRAVTGCDDPVMRLWEVATGKLLRTYRGHTKGPLFVAYVPDGNRALSVSPGDQRLRVWDLQKGKQLIERQPAQQVFGIAIGPDAETVQCINKHGLQTYKIDGPSGSGIGGGRSTYYMPPGTSRYAIRHDPVRPMELLDLTTYRSVRRLVDKTPGVTAVALSADAKQFAWASSNGSIGVGSVDARPAPPEAKVHVVGPTPSWKTPSTRPPWFSYSYVLLIAPRSTPEKQAHPPVVVLDEELLAGGNAAHQKHTLAREIVRQAVLIAAREELGYVARDVRLGEWSQPVTNESPATVRLELQIKDYPEGQFQFVLRKSGSQKTLWDRKLTIAPNDPALVSRLVEAAEGWSRQELPEVLRKAGFKGTDKQPLAGASVPETAEQRLGEMTFTAQFEALRRVRDAMRSQGESPELIGALARGNTNLGLLTDFHWSAAHKAYKARGLLYAHRLASQEEDSSIGRHHLAYAKALCGFHRAALDDLEQAKTATRAATQPDWLEAIDAFCRFDAERLAVLSKDSQLADVLRFFAVQSPDTQQRTLRAASELLEANPECFRVYDAMCAVGGVGNLHSATTIPVGVLWAALPIRIAQMDAPAEVAKIAAAANDNGPSPAEIAAGLRQASTPEADRGEPAWGALASMIDELQFSQTVRRIDFMRYGWSVPVEDYLEAVEPLLGRHRFWPLIALHGKSGEEFKQALNALFKETEFLRLDVAQRLPLLERLQQQDATTHSIYMSVVNVRPEENYQELAALIESATTFRAKPALARRLEQISPHSPLAKATLVRNEEQLSDEQLAAYENSASQQPQVLYVLGMRYSQAKRYADAERVLKTYIKYSPDYGAFWRLAENYKQQGKMDQWEQTLVDYLDEESHGLQHTQVRVQLGEYFMSRQQWEKATAYAEEAAQSYAAWAMHFAVRCYQAQGKLQEADAWYARLAERYPGHDAAYLQWRRQHALVDEKQFVAEQEQQIDQFAQQLPANEMYKAGGAYLRMGRTAKALSAFSKGYVAAADARAKAYNGFFVLLLADELGKPKLRDEILRSLATLDDGSQQRSRKLAELFEASLKAHGEPLDTADVDRILAEASPEDRANLNYFTARFLTLRLRPEDAARYRTACLGKPEERKSFLTQQLAEHEMKQAETGDPHVKQQE